MAKGGSTKTKEVTNAQTTPTAPGWYTGGLQGLGDQINAFGNTDASQYVAPASPLQQQAFTQAGGLTTSPLFGQAAQMAGNIGNVSAGTIKGVGLMDKGLDQYLNPYQDQVTDAYSADFDQTAGQTRAAQAGQAALNGAFGGSRYGIQEAQTEGELARARASGLAGILQGGFDRATSLADSDANRYQGANTANAQLKLQASQANAANQLAAAGLLGNLGQAQGADSRANIGLLGDLGGVQQGIDANTRTAELSQLQALAQLWGGLPTQGLIGQTSNSTSTGTQSQNPGLLGGLGQLIGAGTSIAGLFNPASAFNAVNPVASGAMNIKR